MGYPHITDLNLSHSFNISKPSPFIPNPTNPTNLLPFNHGDLAKSSNANEGSQLITQQQQQQQQHRQPLGSSRWNPTPEQLMTLEELYRRGTRTPSAAQIQQIATRLRRFGKIEGKNVFYWFQNHKARERQKRRRQLNTTEQQQCDTESLENKESGYATRGFEIEPKNNKGSPSYKDFISTHGGISKSGGNEWMQIHEKELRMDPSSSPVPFGKITGLDDENREDQTLELFPLGRNDRNGINIRKNDTQVGIRAITTTPTTTIPNQYFEFLPLKN